MINIVGNLNVLYVSTFNSIPYPYCIFNEETIYQISWTVRQFKGLNCDIIIFGGDFFNKTSFTLICF